MSEHYREQALELPGCLIDEIVHQVEAIHPGLSPIEQGMLYGFVALSLVDPAFTIPGHKWFHSESDYKIDIHVQHPVGKYRTDFALHLTSASGGRFLSEWFAVECDGYQFHHQTREQVTRDKAREREITAAGFKVIRFSGTEIHRGLPGVMGEILKMMVHTYRVWLDAK